MTLVKHIGIFVLTIGLVVPVCADLTIDEVLARMTQAQQSVQDITFSYVLHARQGQFQGRTSGELRLKKPSRLQITQQKPDKQVISTDGTTLWLYSPRQQQVLQGDWKAWVDHSRFPLVLMNFVGAFDGGRWQDRYQGALESHADKLYQIRFVNRGPDAEPPVMLWVSEETFLPVRGDLKSLNSAAQVQIKAIRINTGLTDEELEPWFPEGTARVPVSF